MSVRSTNRMAWVLEAVLMDLNALRSDSVSTNV